MSHDPKLLHSVFQLLIDIRSQITPEPINTILILKDMKLIIRIVIKDKDGMMRGYDLELSYYESLILSDMELVVKTCALKANEFFKIYV